MVAWRQPTRRRSLPDHLIEVVARFTRPSASRRRSTSAPASRPGSRSPRPRRWPPRPYDGPRSTGEELAVARVCDLPAIVPRLRGKVEFEASEEGREAEVLEHLLRRAVADTFRARLGGVDLTGLRREVRRGRLVETGELVPAAELLRRVGRSTAWPSCWTQLGIDGGESPRRARRGRVEFALEGLYLLRRLSKDVDRRPHGLRIALVSRLPVRRVARRARPARAAVRRPRRARRDRRRRPRRLRPRREALRDLLRRGA